MENVLHILPMNKLSGAEKVALLICKNLIQYNPVVVCGGLELKEYFEKERIKAYEVGFNKKNKLSVIKNLKKIIIENDIKIIHAHDNVASIYSYFSKKFIKRNIKVISHIHSCYPWLKKEGLNKKIDSIFRKKYDENIVCGKLVRDFYLENSTYFQNSKFEIVSNAVDIDEIQMKRADEGIYSEFNIPKNKKIIGFIGRLEEMKGIIPFINELIRQREKFDDCIFLLVGNGSQEQNIKKIIKENSLEEKIILTGFQENVYKFYSIMDIFILPSLYEGLPMVILEAMAFRIPVIAMKVGSIHEVVDIKNGQLIEPENYTQFVESIKKIKDDEKLKILLGKNAEQKIIKDYNFKNYIKNMEKIYNNLNLIK